MREEVWDYFYFKVIVGKGLNLLTTRKGLSNCITKYFWKAYKGFADRYDFVHAGVREFTAGG